MILVFGTICLDRVRRAPTMPPLGGYVEITSEDILLGGEAANTANALQTWGVEVVLAGNGLGEDPKLGAALNAKGLIPIIGHIVKPGITPVCDVYVTDDGERTMIGQGFSQMGGTVDPSKLPFKSGEWFTAEPNMATEARQAVRMAHEAGMKIYTMDFVSPDDPIYPGSIWQSSADWIGTRGDSQANLGWVEELAAKRQCLAILTDGPRGFVAASPELRAKFYAPYPAKNYLDATGSGDLFRAGVLYGLEMNWPITHSLRFASAAGCLGCQTLGATEHVPSLDQIQGLIEANPAISAAYD